MSKNTRLRAARRRRQFSPCDLGYSTTWSDAHQYRIWDTQLEAWVQLHAPMTREGVRRYCRLDPERYQPYAVRPIFHAIRLSTSDQDAPIGDEP